MKRVVLFAIFLSLTTTMLQAAPPQVRIISIPRKLPRYSGSYGVAMGVNYHSLRKVAVIKPAVIERKVSSFVTRRRNIQAGKKAENFHAGRARRFDTPPSSTATNNHQQYRPAVQPKQTHPRRTAKRTFTVTTMEDYTPEVRSLEKIPPVPFVEEAQNIAYRGLALAESGDAVRNIWTNGMLTKDVGKGSNTYLRALSAGSRGSMQQLHLHPSISVTNTPSKAAEWAKIRLHPEARPILTIVKMKGNFRGKSMEFIMDDIPAEQIEEMAVLLNIDNELTWCKVQLNEDKSLTITPYEPLYPQK